MSSSGKLSGWVDKPSVVAAISVALRSRSAPVDCLSAKPKGESFGTWPDSTVPASRRSG